MRQDDPETETEEGSGTISSGPGYTFGGIDQKKDEDDKLEEYYNPMTNLLTEIYYSLS